MSYVWINAHGLRPTDAWGMGTLNGVFEFADSVRRLRQRELERENEALANEVVDLHARLRAYADTAGELTRAHRLEDLLEEAIDTLQWLAAGQEVVYAHDVDVVARSLADGLRELKGGEER